MSSTIYGVHFLSTAYPLLNVICDCKIMKKKFHCSLGRIDEDHIFIIDPFVSAVYVPDVALHRSCHSLRDISTSLSDSTIKEQG